MPSLPPEEVMTLMSDLRHELDRAQLDYDLIEHRRTETAGDEARAIGVPPEQVAKTVVLATAVGYVRAVIAASAYLDLHKLRQLLGDKHARLASLCEQLGLDLEAVINRIAVGRSG